MTVPGSDFSAWATVPDSAGEDGSPQGHGANPQRGVIQDWPTLSRRSLLLQAAGLLALSVVAVPNPAMALGLRKSLPETTVRQMKEAARRDVKAVLNQLNRDVPGALNSVAATAVGGGLGSIVSTALLYGLGPVGLAAPGIAGGLAAAGGPVAAGLTALGVAFVSPMVAGVGVLAVPVLAGGTLLGWGANKIKGRGTRPVEKLETAIQELKTIEARLKPARYFRSQIAQIKTYIKELKQQKPELT